MIVFLFLITYLLSCFQCLSVLTAEIWQMSCQISGHCTPEQLYEKGREGGKNEFVSLQWSNNPGWADCQNGPKMANPIWQVSDLTDQGMRAWTILLGILSVLTDPTTLTDGPVRFRSFLSEIDRSDHCQFFLTAADRQIRPISEIGHILISLDSWLMICNII